MIKLKSPTWSGASHGVPSISWVVTRYIMRVKGIGGRPNAAHRNLEILSTYTQYNTIIILSPCHIGG